MKNRQIFILCGLFFLSLLGCSHSANPDAFRVAIESYPASLDPRYPQDAYSSKLQHLIFNGLLKYDDQLQLVPDLAERYDYLSKTVLRFYLREGVQFHDGRGFSANDVRYTFQTILISKNRSPLRDTFKKIKEIRIITPQIFEIELKEPFAPFLTALTAGIIPDQSDEISKIPFTQRSIGTGPFQFDKTKQDQWVQLKRFDAYFEGAPKIPYLKIQTVRDDTTRVLQLLRGETDLVQNAIPLVMSDWLIKHTQLKRVSEAGINYAYLAFNLRDPQFQDRRVREAIALGINRDRLIQHRLKGFARKASGLLAPSNWFYEGEVKQYLSEPERAKKLLDEAGFKDPDGDGPLSRLTLTYKTSNKRDRIMMGRAIAQDLKQIGIDLKVESFEWGTFFRDIKTGNFQIYSSTWVGVTDPDIYYYAFHSSQTPPNGANRGYYKNFEVDQLLDSARRETNPAVQKEYYSKIQKIIAEDLPYVSLWYEDNVVFMRPEVSGYVLRPDASLLGLVNVEVGGKDK